jgi:hypothetical protein
MIGCARMPARKHGLILKMSVIIEPDGGGLTPIALR